MEKEKFGVYEGGPILARMLRQWNLFDFEHLDLAQTWTVFKRFCEVRFDTETDGILFEWLTWPRFVRLEGQTPPYQRVGEEFSLHFCRQLQEHGADEYLQTDCRSEYAVDDMLRSYGSGVEWWFEHKAGESQAEYFARMENTPIFQHLLTSYQPEKTMMRMSGT